jgi:predicted CXXCH cytochrome family protein
MKDCGISHLAAGSHDAGELKNTLSDLCLDCHRDRNAPRSHKVDSVPKMKVKGLPLANGKDTCITCHDPHANTYGSMLRIKSADLCGACHPV